MGMLQFKPSCRSLTAGSRKINKQRMRLLLIISMIVSFTTILPACGNKKDNSKVHRYVKQTKEKYTQKKSATITIHDIPQKSYQSGNQRSPFKPFKEGVKGQYPDAILTHYTLQSLKLTGTLSQGSKVWGMLSTPNGKIYRVTVGSRVGNNYALVTQITQNQVKFKEDTGQSGTHKVIILTIQEPK